MTPDGFPVDMGPSILMKKIGTVPDFWEIQSLADGRIVKAFVYPEDFLRAGPGPRLTGEINELADYSLAQTVIGNIYENPELVHDCGK